MWIVDPKVNEKSVSVTLLLASFTVCIVAAGLEMASVVKSTSVAFELFGACAALYAGRKFTTAKGAVIEKE